MSTLAIVVVLLATIFFVGVISQVPRLLIRPRLKTRLSDLRDEVYDARRADQLPYDNPAVGLLMSKMEAAVTIAERLTLARMLAMAEVTRQVDGGSRVEIVGYDQPSLEGLSEVQIERYHSYENRLLVTLVALPVLGSWPGLLYISFWAPVYLCVTAITTLGSPRERKVEKEIERQKLRFEIIALELNQEVEQEQARRRMAGA